MQPNGSLKQPRRHTSLPVIFRFIRLSRRPINVVILELALHSTYISAQSQQPMSTYLYHDLGLLLIFLPLPELLL